MERRRILVVDDSSIIRSILRRVFEELDFDVRCAETFEGGLESLEETGGSDLLLLDVNLPDANGAEACGLIKAYPAYRDLPIVFISSSNEEYLQEQVEATGAFAYIRKPISPSSVNRWVRAHAAELFGETFPAGAPASATSSVEGTSPVPEGKTPAAEAAAPVVVVARPALGLADMASPPTIVQPPPSDDPPPPEPEPPRGPWHVLLVDDSRFLRSILGDTLERIGLRVSAFESVTAMGDFLDHETVDLALLDVHLPDVEGDRACQIFKARPGPSFPVVLISSEDEERMQALMDSCGADAYLRKPFTPVNVIEWMKARAPEFFGAPLVDPAIKPALDMVEVPSIEEVMEETPDRKQQIDVLLQQLNSAISSVRLDACYSLGELKAARAVDALVELLYGEDDLLKAEAAWALGEIGDGAAVDPLMTLLMMRHPTVRERVVEALGKIGDTRAIEPLIQVLRSGDRDLCILSIKALGALGTERSVEALEEICGEVTDDEVLANAHWALRVIDGADA